ncbi:MAG: Crp/Fnr family transcriptional regulator [Acidobacteriota bacterium]|nr:Crp/Fnr family transcriptional regulator [Acidobacteriota bacterium]
MTARRNVSLENIPLFADLSQTELNFLLDRAVTLHFAAGQPVFSEGDACKGLYVIESGQVKIFRTSPSGREQILTIEGAGASIAELPVFDGGNYPASVSALTDSTLLHIRKNDFQALCLEHREVALKVLKVVGARLRMMVELINELSFASVRCRLASLLLRLAEDTGRKTGQGVVFTLPSTNQELAAQIGTVRELVSRNLGRLQAMGIIQIKGKQVTVPDLRALEEEVSESD